MWRSIIAVVLLLLFSNPLQAQSFEERLLALEYAAFKADDDSTEAVNRFLKTQLYIDSGRIDEALMEETKRVKFELLDLELQPEFVWNAALTSYLLNDQFYAVYYISKLEEYPDSLTHQESLLKFLIYNFTDQEVCSTILSEIPEFAPLSCLNDVTNYTLKGKKWRKVASAIVPGSGMFINGAPGKGAIALLLTTGSVIGLRWLFINELYVNLFGWTVNGALKFYLGNIKLTDHLNERRELAKKSALATDCETSLHELLEKYPLNFR